jgi:hypothetical protein
MKRNHFKGKYTNFKNDEATSAPAVNQTSKTKRKNRFSGMYGKYNDESGNIEKENFTPGQKKIIHEALNELKDSLVTSIGKGISTGAFYKQEDEAEKQKRQAFPSAMRFMSY